jgi:hypothetical protein
MSMDAQSWIVAIVVTLAAAYSLWTLMPAAWRRRLARRLVRVPALVRWPMLQSAADTDGGCAGCGERCAAPRPAVGAPVGTVMRGPQRSRRQ